MKHLLISLLVFVSSVLGGAAQTSDLDSAVGALAERCPYNYRDGWVLESVTQAPGTVILTFDVNLPGAYYQSMKEGGDAIKPMWLGNINAYGPIWQNLLKATVTSGGNLEMKLHSKADPAGFSVIFTNDDLRGVY